MLSTDSAFPCFNRLNVNLISMLKDYPWIGWIWTGIWQLCVGVALLLFVGSLYEDRVLAAFMLVIWCCVYAYFLGMDGQVSGLAMTQALISEKKLEKEGVTREDLEKQFTNGQIIRAIAGIVNWIVLIFALAIMFTA